MKRIYLDYAATAPVDKRVAKAMRDFELKNFGNPSSSHREGQVVRGALDFARTSVAEFLHAKPQEIIFTSGATEANNLAILGTVNRYQGKSKPHVVTTTLEHHSVYNTVKELEKKGIIEATFVHPDKTGKIKADDVLNAVKKNTVLVSVIFVCNEIGTILPVREIGNGLAGKGITYHVDAVQAAKFYNCHVEKLGCDLLTLSGHKLRGPKGIGALYVKAGSKLENIAFGGSQEYGLRPGTQNTAGIIGFAESIKLLGSLEAREKTAGKIFKNKLKFASILMNAPGVSLNGTLDNSFAPDILSVNIEGVDQDGLMTLLDLNGIAASTGSACVSGSTEPSHVIASLRDDPNSSTLRLSFGAETTNSDLVRAGKVITQAIIQLRN